jgi:hypothetical protein
MSKEGMQEHHFWGRRDTESFTYYSQPLNTESSSDSWDKFLEETKKKGTIRGFLSVENILIWSAKGGDFSHTQLLSATNQPEDPLAYFRAHSVGQDNIGLMINIYSELAENGVRLVADYMERSITMRRNEIQLILKDIPEGELNHQEIYNGTLKGYGGGK